MIFEENFKMKHKSRVLIIDDEISLRKALRGLFEKNHYEVICVGSKKEALNLNPALDFDLALVDMILPDGDGLELITLLKKTHPRVQIMILTGHGSIESAVSAMRKGAFHFFTKPFSMDEVLNVCKKALKQRDLEKENESLRACVKKQYSFEHIIGQSEPILKLLETIKKSVSLKCDGAASRGKRHRQRAFRPGHSF